MSATQITDAGDGGQKPKAQADDCGKISNDEQQRRENGRS